MILQLAKPQKAIVRTVKEFAKGEFDKETILDMDKEGRFPNETLEKAAELGFLGIHLPENIGGGGMEMTDFLLIAQDFTKHDSTLGAAVILAGIGAEWISSFAGKELKEKLLPDLLEGKIISGAVLPKPGIGVTISESSDKGTFIVNGEVDNVINGPKADVLFLPLKSPDNGFVVIEVSQEGVSQAKQHQPMGLRMTGSSKIQLNNVSISSECCIQMKKNSSDLLLSPIQMMISFLALGTAQGAIDRSIDYIKGREQFGRKIASFQVLRHKIADMATRLNQARSIAWLAAQNYSSKKPDTALSAMVCLSCVNATTQITYDAIQLFGGYGYTVEYEVERFCRDAKTLQMISRGSIPLYDDIADSIIGKIK